MEEQTSEKELIEKQAERAVEKAYDEHLITNHHSPDVGRVGDIAYAKALANQEDDTRMVNPESKKRGEYAENITDLNIIKDMEEVAARKISQNKDDMYPDAHDSLVRTGINPVERYHSKRRAYEINEMQEAEEKRRKFKEEQQKLQQS